MIKFTNKTVPASALRVSKCNWQRNVDDESIADLAASIEETGNIHPVTVRPVGKAGHMYEVIAGRRRYLAQQLLGFTKIEVRVAKLNDLDAEIFSYTENLKIERPNSKEWSKGVKRLVDLFEKKHKIGSRRKTKRPAITKGLEGDEFRETASLNSGRGRRATPKQQAVKDVAKTVKADPKTVRKAVKREEDLIPSAARALELGKISQEQADILAKMPKKRQQVELRNMVLETRNETRRRVHEEHVEGQEGKHGLIAEILRNIYSGCAVIKARIDDVATMLPEETSDYTDLINQPKFASVEELRDALTDLLEILER